MQPVSRQPNDTGATGAPAYYRGGAALCLVVGLSAIFMASHAGDFATRFGLYEEQVADVWVPLIIGCVAGGFGLLIGRPASVVAVIALIHVGSGPLSGPRGLGLGVIRLDTTDTYPTVIRLRPAKSDVENLRAGEAMGELAEEFVSAVTALATGKGPGYEIRNNVPYDDPTLGALKRAASRNAAQAKQPVVGEALERFEMPDWSGGEVQQLTSGERS